MNRPTFPAKFIRRTLIVVSVILPVFLLAMVFGIVRNFLPLAYAQSIAIGIAADPIAFFKVGEPEQDVFGRLRYIGGISYSATNGTLGGLSGVRVLENGKKFLAISDKGFWFSGSFVRGDRGEITGISGARIASMRNKNGAVFSSKKNGDAEGLEIVGDKALVSFERNSRILKYSIDLEKLDSNGRNFRKQIRRIKLPRNNGLEAITVLEPVKNRKLRGVRIATFSEHSLNNKGNIRGFVSKGKKWKAFSVNAIGKYKITDATLLEDESILLLERRFSFTSGASIRIRKIPVAMIKPGALVDGVIIFEADNRFEIDNLEGISAWKNEAGQTIVTLISDDNFSYLQRNILLEFELLAAKTKADD